MAAKNRRLLIALVFPVLFALAPCPAEARFGKRSSSGGAGSGSAAGGSPHGASGAAAGTYYAPRYYPVYRSYGWPFFYDGWGFWHYSGFGYYPPYYYYPYAYPVPEQPTLGQTAPPPPIKTRIFAEGQTYRGGGGTVGANLGFEGQRFGINAQFTSIFTKDDQTINNYLGADTTKLFNIYATYALVATPQSRLRIEGGLMSAFAPDLTVAGPGIGFSALVNVLGPLGLEGAVHGTPFPFRELDWNAGVALTFGPLGLAGGWRRIFLDDRGLVDNVVNKDSFSGPYVRLGVTL